MALFEPVFEALSAAEVRFVVVGGVATVLHGHPRLTADLDLAIDLEEEQAHAAINALLGLGLRPGLPVDAHDFADPETRQRWVTTRNLTAFSLRHPEQPMLEVDLLATSPIAFDDLWGRATTVEIGTVSVRIAAISDLITMKRAAGRAQDLADIEVLEELRTHRGSGS